MPLRGWSHFLAAIASLGVRSFAARVDVSDSFSLAELNEGFANSSISDVDIVEYIPDMLEGDVAKVMEWIKAETTMVKNAFCWKRSKGRGLGSVLSECPSGREKITGLCYSHCPTNMKRFGVNCHSTCPSGFRDDGLYCRKAEYGRGVGYAWKWGDGWSDRGMYDRCERDEGAGNCEKWGAIVYPKCKPGYHNFGCCICRPARPNCGDFGLGHQFDLSCAKKIKLGDPTPLICKSHLEQSGLLCYERCDHSFYGVGPVCWGECDNSQVNCGAACAKTSKDCALTVVSQTVAPLLLAANVASLGMAKPATTGATVGLQSVRIGGKAMTSSSKVGKALIHAVKSLEKVSRNAKVTEAVRVARQFKDFVTGEQMGRAVQAVYVGMTTYKAQQQYRAAYAEDFAHQTSQEISDELDRNFIPETSNYLKAIWGDVQLQEMAKANHWQIAQTALEAASIFSSVGYVVSAYTKPICGDIVPFPIIERRSP
eukprot:TRINITY_DN11986_c1_g3_i1.p1 TRINITY_DN11986_c1_g3~~TRINITY_DN11986_c1_g3_i1.p1  ORF type:complete len:483 (-),score=44.99 TRINITY_DN11986_c1_g3_i1:78-1526(-)